MEIKINQTGIEEAVTKGVNNVLQDRVPDSVSAAMRRSISATVENLVAGVDISELVDVRVLSQAIAEQLSKTIASATSLMLEEAVIATLVNIRVKSKYVSDEDLNHMRKELRGRLFARRKELQEKGE